MFGLEIVLYLCLGGLGGGLCVVAGIVELIIPCRFSRGCSLPERSSLMESAFAIAAASLVLGGLLLLADTGNHAALVYLFLAAPFGYLSVGAWFIVIAVGLCFVSMLFWRVEPALRKTMVSRVLHAACVFVGLAVVLYTGLFLASMKAVPLWNTAWLPMLFVLSSLSCGIIFFLALIQVSGKTGRSFGLEKMLVKTDILVVALELICTAALVASAAMAPVSGSTDAAAAASVIDLVSGEYAWVWWGGFVGLGLLATALLDVVILRTESVAACGIWSTLGPSVCVLIGAFSLRFGIVAAGMHPVVGF